LGHLIVPRRAHEPWVPVDDTREELATRVLELAGAGRAAALRDDRPGVLKHTGRAMWLEAWEHAVHRVAQRVAERVDRDIEAAGYRVRMPRRARRARLLTAAERRAIAARLASGAGPFVATLDALDGAALRVREGGAFDATAHALWQDELCRAARRLEAAWLALEAQVEGEAARWAPEIADTARWRPSLWPLFSLWVPLAALLLWLGLVIGGYLPAPRRLALWLGF
jgi:hypothetical protein